MNTSKQINAMIMLLAVLLIGVGAYTIWDPFRADAETERTRELIAERAAHTYATNCRVCHGNDGEGRIGPALEPEARKRSNLPDYTDPNKRKEYELLVRNTITCGRIGTVMPPWAQAEGGALTDEQIRQLTILITENPGGAWANIVHEISEEEEHIAPMAPVQDVLKGAVPTGASAAVCGQPPKPASPTATPTPPPVSSNITIVATDNRFDQAALAVPANQSVTLRLDNRGAAVHNWSVTAAGRTIETRLITGGQTDTINFNISQTGTYAYLCTVHPQDMRGILFVQP